MTSINIDSTNVGLVLSVRALMEIPFLFFIVKLRRRFQLRYLIMLAAAFMGVECLLLGLFVTTLPEFVVFAAVFGFGNGLFIGTATNYIYELAPVELRATAHGLLQHGAEAAVAAGQNGLERLRSAACQLYSMLFDGILSLSRRARRRYSSGVDLLLPLEGR